MTYTFFFFFNDTATTEIYTLSLHDALPIFARQAQARERHRLIEELQIIARAGRAPGLHGSLPSAKAVDPQQRADDDEEDGRGFPHRLGVLFDQVGALFRDRDHRGVDVA